MPQYAIIISHPADICPLTNKRVREFAKKKSASYAELQQELGVKSVLEIHLDPAHKAFLLFESPTAESVRDYLVRSGYMHYTQMEFYLVTPIAELLKKADQIPTLYE
jgi:hypothetical protein